MSGDSAVDRGVALDPSTLSFLPAVVRRPRDPLPALLVAYLLSFIGSMLIGAIVASIAPGAKTPDFGWLVGRGLFTVAVLSGLAPLMETLILAGTTSLLLLMVKPRSAILLSSAGWALAHSYQAPIWGLIICWPFIIFNTLFIVWKQRSLGWGLFMPFAAHALQNLLPAIAIGFPDLVPD